MREIRWHARAGQGAKTASQIYATAMLRSGKHVQSFPEYGPERRGAPMRAYTRVDDRPIRRRDAVDAPDVVVVLEPSLVAQGDVVAGLGARGLLLVNATAAPAELRARTGCESEVICVPGERIAAEYGQQSTNLIMAGALAAALGEPDLETLVAAATEVLGTKAGREALRAPIAAGFAAVREDVRWAA